MKQLPVAFKLPSFCRKKNGSKMTLTKISTLYGQNYDNVKWKLWFLVNSHFVAWGKHILSLIKFTSWLMGQNNQSNLLLIGKKHQYLIKPNRSTIDLTFPYLLPYIVTEFGRNRIVKRLYPFLIMNILQYHQNKDIFPP